MKNTDQMWIELVAAKQAGDRLTFVERLIDLKIAIIMAKQPLLPNVLAEGATSMNEWKDLNLNDRIRFKLTKRGEQIWREFWLPYCSPGHDPLANVPPDADGWREDQLWRFAAILGPHLETGLDVPAQTVIQVRVQD